MQFVQSKQELKMFSGRGSSVATPDNESAYDDPIDNSMTASGMGSGSMYRSKVRMDKPKKVVLFLKEPKTYPFSLHREHYLAFKLCENPMIIYQNPCQLV
jgi:hypothetical protein